MNKLAKKFMVLFVLGNLVLIPFGTAAMAQDQSINENTDPYLRMACDIILARPLGIVGTITGTALFVVSLPFSAMGGNTQDAYQKLIVEPAKYTFNRPLGEF